MSDAAAALIEDVERFDATVELIENQKEQAKRKKTRVEKMQSIDEKIARLQRRKEKLEAQEAEARRRVETRCKILAGAVIMKLLLSSEKLSKKIIADEIFLSATRESEKNFFKTVFGELL